MGCKRYRFRARPSASQVKKALEWIEMCRNIFNAALQERLEAWRVSRKSLTLFDQQKELTEVRRALPEYQSMSSAGMRTPLRRLDSAFRLFFEGKRARPRFKSRQAYRSIEWPDGFTKLRGHGLIWLGKFGLLKFVQHREIKGDIRSCSLKFERDGSWHITIFCENAPPEFLGPAKFGDVGVDLGIWHYAALSDGTVVERPVPTLSLTRLPSLDSKLGRKAVGSKRREKARILLAKAHSKLVRQRDDFQWKLANKLFREFQTVYVEDLDVAGMLKVKPKDGRTSLRRLISGAAWGEFLQKLASKAESAGREFMKVDPAFTSQECSECGRVEKKELSQRQHVCPCGYTADRDVNAARNILRRGRRLREAAQAASEKPLAGRPVPEGAGDVSHSPIYWSEGVKLIG